VIQFLERCFQGRWVVFQSLDPPNDLQSVIGDPTEGRQISDARCNQNAGDDR